MAQVWEGGNGMAGGVEEEGQRGWRRRRRRGGGGGAARVGILFFLTPSSTGYSNQY